MHAPQDRRGSRPPEGAKTCAGFGRSWSARARSQWQSRPVPAARQCSASLARIAARLLAVSGGRRRPTCADRSAGGRGGVCVRLAGGSPPEGLVRPPALLSPPLEGRPPPRVTRSLSRRRDPLLRARAPQGDLPQCSHRGESAVCALRARSQGMRGSCAPFDAARGPLSPRAPRYRRCVPRRVRARFCSGSRGHRVFTDPPGPQPPSRPVPSRPKAKRMCPRTIPVASTFIVP